MSLPRIDTMPVDFAPLEYDKWSQGKRFVYDWVADPTMLLGEIADQWLKDPTDLTQIGREVAMIFAQIDKERRDHESEDA